MELYEVDFQPDGIKIQVPEKTSLAEAAQRAGIVLDGACGGKGTCNKCLVGIVGREGWVRSCQYSVDRDLAVNIPDTSRFFEQKILLEGATRSLPVEPWVWKHHLELPPPCLDDLRSDAARLIDDIERGSSRQTHLRPDHTGNTSAGERVAWPLLRRLPTFLREHHWSVTAICHGNRVIALEPGDTTKISFGLAVDIGTTTVVASLINLIDGKTAAVASETNPQAVFGDDVISRAEYSRVHAKGLDILHQHIIDGINRLVDEVCEKAHVSSAQIYEMTVVGNTTMQHLFLGIPVEHIAQAPYVAAVSSAVNVPAAATGVKIHPEGNVYVMSSVAGHVGGDTVAVALAVAMRQSPQITLAVDIGTNGEIILGNQKRLLACSTAAGPAFEGARIRHGMRGAVGAIERVHIGQTVDIAVIGATAPRGICGSGLVDALAELLNLGVLDSSGRLLPADELPAAIPDEIRRRLIEYDHSTAFVLAWPDQTRHGQPIFVTQRDIREAQLGKAAISAGIVMLQEQLQIELSDIHRLYLAGAFGNYIRPESARRIGLLPPLPLEKMLFVGNAAGAGAREVLINAAVRDQSEHLAREMEYVELAGKSRFESLFSEKIFFPEP